MLLEVSSQFRPQCPVRYPAHQVGPRMEEAMHEYMKDYSRHFEDPRAYLPIYWDNYHVSTGFGRGVGPLQRYVNEMCVDRKCWTVCEYRDGTLVRNENLTVFCAGGNGPASDIPIPLLCDPHPANHQENPKYLATFCGSLTTHPIRQELQKRFGNRPGYHISGPVSTDQFRFLMDNSKWALCPRGSGPTSYRLYEAIQMGCVPVYIGDRFWLPFRDELDWTSFCVLVTLEDVPHLDSILAAYSDRYEDMRRKARMAFESHLSMNACCREIVRRAQQI